MLKVDIKNISRTDQDNKIIVLRDIQFTIDPGKVYIILGKNGSGKSTLIKSLTNLLNKNIFDIDGSVIWNDENIFTVNEDKLILIRKNEIRYVLQDLTNNFDPLKNIKYYLRSYITIIIIHNATHIELTTPVQLHCFKSVG